VARALISLYEKSDIETVVRPLAAAGWAIVASGGTADAIADLGVGVERVEDLSGYASMLDGRVKTLHPAIFAPILADLVRPHHAATLAEQRWEPIDLVVVGLYPFWSAPSVDLIDIGGPSLVRAAAKNAERVTVIVDPGDFALVSEVVAGRLGAAERRRLAAKAFATTSAYDQAVASWLADDDAANPSVRLLALERVSTLRYGENPHQSSALYAPLGARRRGFAAATWQGGLEPSWLNIADADAAARLVRALGPEPAAVVVKHAGPCGAAVAPTLREAYELAFEGDPVSAFGGVVALGGTLDLEVADALLARPKADVIVARALEPEAAERILAKRRRTRIVTLEDAEGDELQLRSVVGGLLVQSPDELERPEELVCMTSREPSAAERRDAWIALVVCAHTTSNAVVVARGGAAVGVGQGQPSRVDAARLAVTRAGARAEGAAAASDAFFPFPDGLEVLADAGVRCVVAPAGSVRDEEIRAVAEARGLSLLVAPRRHFRH
jgi:phosphoribosylaminoimidazolecarboxamide formyltransferase/IMP cyclohydrolase